MRNQNEENLNRIHGYVGIAIYLTNGFAVFALYFVITLIVDLKE